jgi:hypothetical protein
MLNKKAEIKKYNKPFPIFHALNFFEGDFFLELEKYFPHQNKFTTNKVGRMHGDTTFGDQLYEKILENSKAYKMLHNWVYSDDFLKYFLDIFKEDLEIQEDLVVKLNDLKISSSPFEVGSIYNKKSFVIDGKDLLYPRLDLGYGLKNYGVETGGKGPHIDNPQRLISILIYVGGFSKISGGEHRVYDLQNNDLEVFKVFNPTKNSIIASVQNNSAFHDVNPVTEIDGQRNAFYLAISSTKKIWKPSVRNAINLKYNKNRVELSFFQKLINKFS